MNPDSTGVQRMYNFPSVFTPILQARTIIELAAALVAVFFMFTPLLQARTIIALVYFGNWCCQVIIILDYYQ